MISPLHAPPFVHAVPNCASQIVAVLKVAPDGRAIPPNVFRLADTDRSRSLSSAEIEAHYRRCV